MTTSQIADRLVALCRAGKNLQAVDELYGEQIVSSEMFGNEKMPKDTIGKQAVRRKNEWWLAEHEVHSGMTDGPLVAEAHFSVRFAYDVTMKSTGKRMQMVEIAVYEVAGDKIVREQFFYRM